MKKRKLVAAAAIAACVAAVSMGTLSYFTASDVAHNVITSGLVDIEVREWADEARTQEFPEDGVDRVMPGTSVTKIVEAENVGTNAVWVRIRADKAIELAEGRTGEIDLSLLAMDIDTEHWTEQDGWYYYLAPLEAGETTVPLFTSVTFAADMGNTYQGCTATVDVTVQAVQTANNGTSALDAAGWPEE